MQLCHRLGFCSCTSTPISPIGSERDQTTHLTLTFSQVEEIEGAARTQAWSATARGLIGELGVGTTTASAIQLAMAVAGLIAAVGLLALVTGFGLIWASRAPIAVPSEVRSPTFVATPGVLPAPVSPR